MLRYKGLIAGLISVVAMLLVSFAHADDDYDSHVRIVRMSYIEGQVQISHRQGIGYENATMNVPVVEGDQIRTIDNGWAEIQLEDGSTIRLAPDSQITFSALGRFSGGGAITEVNLDDGEAEFKVSAHDDSTFRVNVRQRVIALTHSGRFRVTTSNSDPLELVVWKGEVAVLNPDDAEQVAVRKNETFVLDPMDSGRYDLEKTAQADDLDQWVAEREDYLSSYAASARSVAQSPYVYGLNDLNYYGSYVDVPGYGYCWRPYGVNLGWDPFVNGYWTYSPGFGYVWVSAYPWGWMPYRYGRWAFVGGYGWIWQPGLWNRWTPVPRFVNPPSGFRAPVPPAATVSAPVPYDGGPVRRTVQNPAPNVDGSPARLSVTNPALSTTTGNNNRPVISNEHSPVRRIGDADSSAGFSNGSNPAPANNIHPPAGSTAPANNGQQPVRVHPPSVIRPMEPVHQPRIDNPPPTQQRVINTPPPVMRSVTPPPAPVHVSPPAQSFSRPSPPPASAPSHSFSPPASHSDNSSGPHKR